MEVASREWARRHHLRPVSNASCYRRRFPMPTFYSEFVRCAERWPDQPALQVQKRDELESYTYAQTRRMAECIGRWIQESGIAPGSRLAILADNHPRWVMCYLGTIAAGCTVVPLDT